MTTTFFAVRLMSEGEDDRFELCGGADEVLAFLGDGLRLGNFGMAQVARVTAAQLAEGAIGELFAAE